MDTDLLSAVIYTLNSIEVHGEKNLDRLLGCIRVLETLRKQEKKEVKEESNG